MTILITHPFVSAKGDGTDATLVRPSNWNAAHTTSMATSKLLGRSTAGVGSFEELAISALMLSLLNSADANAFMTTLGVGVFSTGDAKVTLKTAADPGWVMMDDGTIGDGSSGASSRANADTSSLFTLIYNNILDVNAPLLTSVGSATTRATQGSAAAAYAAHCRVSLPKQLGRALISAGAGAGLTARFLGGPVGGETTALVTANLPPQTPSGSVTLNSLAFNAANVSSTSGGGNSVTTGGFSATGALNLNAPTSSLTFTGSAFAGQISTPLSVVQPSTAWFVMVKL